MTKPIYFTDIDGTLLNFQEKAGEVLGKQYKAVHPTLRMDPPLHYDFEEAFGITRGEYLVLMDEMWEVPLEPYKGAVSFVKELKRDFRVLGISMRPDARAQVAAYRDTPILDLDGLYLVDETAKKAPLITKLSEGEQCFYLDDKIQTAIDVSLKCLNARVQLINRPWNKSMDLCLEYDRVFTFDAAADGARFIYGRGHWREEDFRIRSDPWDSPR